MVKIHNGIEFDNREHAFDIASIAGCSYHPDEDRVISRTISDQLAGGVIYQDHIPRGMITMHAGAWDRRWLSKEMRWVIFAYPFDQLEVKLCLATVMSSNARSLKLCKGLGFVVEHILADAVPDGDMVVLSMRKLGCRWLQGPAPDGFLKGAGNG